MSVCTVMEDVPIPVSIQEEVTTVNVLLDMLFYLTDILVLKVTITISMSLCHFVCMLLL